MILTPPSTPTSQLTYDPATRTYSGEVSSTNGFGRVYDDACDEGLTLVSASTGREIIFVVVLTARVDGEVTGWTLRPVTNADITLVLFND